MILKTNNQKAKNVLLFLYFLYKFRFLLNLFYSGLDISDKFNRKKNLFFKKKYLKKNLISKRLSFFLKKKSSNLKRLKKIDKGNFFFKKFFFKLLLKNRKFLKNFLFVNKKTRQANLNKLIFKQTLKKPNFNFENTVLNILLKSSFFTFINDVITFLNKGLIYLNGFPVTKQGFNLLTGDCLQIPVTNILYKYVKTSKKILKKKITLFKLVSWKFFKKNKLKKRLKIRQNKKKKPKYLDLLFLFKFNTPNFLEVDYFTMSVFIIFLNKPFFRSSYFLNKFFTFKLLSLYNFKKIN